MSYSVCEEALATDYDGAIAQHGSVNEATIDSLRRFEWTGRRLVLVTGRDLPDLRRALPAIGLSIVWSSRMALSYTIPRRTRSGCLRRLRRRCSSNDCGSAASRRSRSSIDRGHLASERDYGSRSDPGA